LTHSAASQLEKIRTIVVDDHQHIARLVANRIATLIAEKQAAGERTVLGLATGSTPIGVYRELIRMHRAEGLSFRGVVTFNLDEYYPMRGESIHSYRRFMWENLFSQIDIDRRSVHILQGEVAREDVDDECRRYEDAIARAGGIDLQILGIGKTGHIGFNEPGSGAESRTRLVMLDAITRRDAAADFFGEDFVPREALTMGIATILEDEIAILATGEHKAPIVHRAIEGEIDRGCGNVSSEAPEHHVLRRPCRRRRAHAQCDAMAARRGGMDAGPHRARVAWLSQKVGRGPDGPARLRRAQDVLAGRAIWDTGRGERRGVQHVRREDPRQEQAVAREAHHLLLAASGR
jgi:glucosamine-6-phosphate isomerase